MLQQVPVKFENVIQVPRDKLISDSLLDASLIYLSFADDSVIAKWLMGDMNIVCTPPNFPSDQGMLAGGGNTTTVFEGVYGVAIWVRLWVDEMSKDDTWLTDQTLGAAAMVSKVLTSLNMYFPLNASNQYVLVQPMRVKPNFSVRPKQVESWGKIDTQWEFMWQQDMS